MFVSLGAVIKNLAPRGAGYFYSTQNWNGGAPSGTIVRITAPDTGNNVLVLAEDLANAQFISDLIAQGIVGNPNVDYVGDPSNTLAVILQVLAPPEAPIVLNTGEVLPPPDVPVITPASPVATVGPGADPISILTFQQPLPPPATPQPPPLVVNAPPLALPPVVATVPLVSSTPPTPANFLTEPVFTVGGLQIQMWEILAAGGLALVLLKKKKKQP